MDFLHVYDSLDDIWGLLDRLKTRQYEWTDIPLTRRDELSSELFAIQEEVQKIKNEVQNCIEDEWL